MLSENEHAKTCIVIVHLHADHHLHSHQYMHMGKQLSIPKIPPPISNHSLLDVCIQSDKETHAQLGVLMCDGLKQIHP